MGINCNCSNCVYQRYPRIPATQVKQAPIAIVGEAPGVMEIAKKRPFIGPSGDVLRKSFAHVGLPSPDDCFISNALLCRPPAKKAISKAAIANCQKRLFDELRQVQPKIVLAFGNTAMHALTSDFKLKITKAQGQVIESESLPGVPIVPVLHPAAIMRAGGKYKQFLQALDRACKVFKTGEVKKPPTPSYHVVENGTQLDRAIQGLIKQPILGGDIETHGNPRTGRIIDLGVCWNNPQGTEDKVGRVLIFPEDMIPYTKPLFEAKGPKWIWQGGKYDMEWLWEKGLPARLDHDTMMLHYALVEQTGTHDLDQLSMLYLGDDPYKSSVRDYTKGKKIEGYGDVPKEVLWPYLAKDVDRMVRLFHIFHPMVMKDPGLKRLYYSLLLPANRFLTKVQRKGLMIHQENLQDEDIKLQAEIDEMTNEIADMAAPYWDKEEYLHQTKMKSAPDRFNPNSTYQLAWLLFDKMRLKPKRKKGRSTDKDVLESMKHLHDIIPKLLEYKKVKKLHSTYINGTKKWIEEDGRIHTGFKVHGTVTGRLSSSQPNVQNIPKKIRRIYRAAPGNTLIDADYSGAELRVLAYVSGDEALQEIFRQGRSLHKEVAAEFFGSDYDDAQYMRAKAVNFGIAYGRTEYSLSAEMEIPKSEAKGYIDSWNGKFPQAHAYLLNCDKAALQGKVLTTDLGRKRRFGLITEQNIDDLQNEARNFRIQSIASDLTLISAMRAQPLIARYGAHVVNLVHDSIIVECPEEHVKPVCKILNDIMYRTPAQLLKTDIPFVSEFKVGKVWGKEMEDYELTS